jgi:hypothetical protein
MLKNRQDTVLIKTWQDRGVPEDHIVFLEDEQGTLAAIRESFKSLLERTEKDDFLIFAFSGHGGRDIDDNARSRYYFVNYDADDDNDERDRIKERP